MPGPYSESKPAWIDESRHDGAHLDVVVHHVDVGPGELQTEEPRRRRRTDHAALDAVLGRCGRTMSGTVDRHTPGGSRPPDRSGSTRECDGQDVLAGAPVLWSVEIVDPRAQRIPRSPQRRASRPRGRRPRFKDGSTVTHPPSGSGHGGANGLSPSAASRGGPDRVSVNALPS